MKLPHQFKALLIFFLLVSTVFSAQAKFPGVLTRYQIGYSFVNSTAEYKGMLKTYDQKQNYLTDTPWNETIHTSAAFGVTMGTYIPIKRLGRVSTLATNIDFTYDFKYWKNVAGGLYSELADLNISGVSVEIGVPITLDFKFGCDATCAKNQRFCTTLGAGIYPTFAFTSFEDNAATGFGMAPVVKYEVGFYKGICMKFRVLYSFDNIQYISKSGSVFKQDDLASNFTLTGKSTLTISAVFMPFSFLWERKGWWNTY